MTTEVFGRPVSGEVFPVGSLPDQAPESEFLEALDRVLSIPGIEAVRWEQFTPYFNDGEACVFSTGETRVKVSGSEDSGEYGDDYLTAWDLYDYDKGYQNRTWKTFPSLGISAEVLSEVISHFNLEGLGKKHHVFLGKTFGDHAQVTATSAGFDVEFYEHD